MLRIWLPLFLLPFTVTLAYAETSPEVTPTEAEVAQAVEDPAIAFLRRVEERNADLRTIEASFNQIRRDFLEEVKSEGTFWYESPNRFHATYRSRHSAMYWMTDTELIEFNPSLRQVDIIALGTGEDAPINQLLLGFGVKVAEIQRLFDVELISKETGGAVVVELTSRDLSRTLDFRTITITFDEATADPRQVLMDDGQSELLLEFTRITRNRQIDSRLFEPRWPGNTEVIRHRRV